MRLILTFYRSFAIASSIITLASLSAVAMNGLKVLSTVLMFKLIMLGIIILYINLFRKKEFYYYQNLGLSKSILWIYTLTIDLVIFFLLIVVLVWIL